ncbi:MAG: hypothetical protein EOP42_15200 [Sphingobacteriaceae bacterium]|nr:MAG: hypothetical protein EOP42_15200 [Sphingobacteriaceae bacterium]
MPEVIIKYEDPKTLEVLEELSKSMNFEMVKENDNVYLVNGVTIIKGNKNVDLSDIRQLFTAKNMDAKTLRTEAWQRKK